MPVRQNTIISSPEKSIPPSTAKPPSMDTAAAASKKKYHVLRVNLSFMSPSPRAFVPGLQKNLKKNCKYYSTNPRRLCYNKENSFGEGLSMNAVVSVCLLACALGIIVYLLSRRETTRRSQYGPAGLSEFRTGLALDECFDRLDTCSDTDLFAYECRRENDGSFLLHLTLHQPSQQPLDTLYTLRLDPGRQTVVTLIFIREAFGYKEPLFPPAMLDEFMLQKLDAHRTK